MKTNTVTGKYGIKATVLKRSISKHTGIEFITFEIEYPRIVLAELNTHRALSKNSFSSRAVPFLKMLDQLLGRPVRFGANQSGMQDKGEDFNAFIQLPNGFGGSDGYDAERVWLKAKDSAVEFARAFHEAGYHKQVYNRLLEPWQMMKTVISGTEWGNFFWLRDHDAADPTLHELARVMKQAREESDFQVLESGEWHLPYVDTFRRFDGTLFCYGDYDILKDEWTTYDLSTAIKVSCARCAAVSYRNEGYGPEKSKEVHDRLVGDDRKHASALEHCGEPMIPQYADATVWFMTKGNINACNIPEVPKTWQTGVTHMDAEGQLWSGNIRGWIQYRKTIPGENFVESYGGY